MFRGLLGLNGFLLVVALACLYFAQTSGRMDVRSLWRPLPELDVTYQRGFRSDVMARINEVRLGASVELVAPDESLQSFLADYTEKHPNPLEMDLDQVFNDVQQAFPGAQYLAANLISSHEREDLLDKLSEWTSASSSDFGAVTTHVFRVGNRLGALGVMSTRIPAFSLAQANKTGGRFHNQCPHCGENHALELAKDSLTLILSCPYCDLPFHLLAADRHGKLHHVSDYFDQGTLPELTISGETEKEQLVSLWQQVSERCRYQTDQEAFNVKEAWRHSHETWNEQAGDCEDTSILLADYLIKAGFKARVAIGWNGNIGQHAWIVIQLKDGEQILIESTLESPITLDSIKSIEEASAFYQPEQLFDRNHIYFTTSHPNRFKSDYFSPDLWRHLPTTSETPSNLTQR